VCLTTCCADDYRIRLTTHDRDVGVVHVFLGVEKPILGNLWACSSASGTGDGADHRSATNADSGADRARTC